MTAQPPLPSLSAVDQAREDARRQARALSGSLMMVLGIIAAVVIIGGFAALDYSFGQNPHRLVKLSRSVQLQVTSSTLPLSRRPTKPLGSPSSTW